MMRLKGEKGQSAVEFALILPILIILLCGIIDFGWLYNCDIAAKNAAREAARYTAIHLYDSSTDDDLEKAKSIVKANAPQLPPLDTRVTLTCVDLDNDGFKETVKIDVSAPVPLVTGFTSILLGKKSITISATSIMKIE